MPDNAPEFVVVLGAQVHGSEPSLTLKKRLERAYEYMTEHPEATVFVSGGQGPDETQTEASVMAAYLERKGIASERIVQVVHDGLSVAAFHYMQSSHKIPSHMAARRRGRAKLLHAQH